MAASARRRLGEGGGDDARAAAVAVLGCSGSRDSLGGADTMACGDVGCGGECGGACGIAARGGARDGSGRGDSMEHAAAAMAAEAAVGLLPRLSSSSHSRGRSLFFFSNDG